MQNAADALKISFAVFVFIIALSITFSSVSQVKKTSDFILYHIDKTNFYDNLNASNLETTNGGRIVKIDTIIANLYRIIQESFEVSVVIDGNIQNFGLNEMTATELSEAIEDFKSNYINKSYDFIETFSEITYTGEYLSADDGSGITIVPGIKKIYITYTKV